MKTHAFASGTLFLKSVSATLIFLIALTSDGFSQYAKLVKGQPNPFDTAVAVRIDRYRMEGKKLALGQQLIDSLLLEIAGLNTEVIIGDSINQNNRVAIAILTKANTRKDSVNSVIRHDFDKLYGIIEEQNAWYRRPEYYVGALVILELIRFFTSNR